MRIATWNVERLKHRKEMGRLVEEIRKADADILVLTETDTRLCPEYPYIYQTLALVGEQKFPYADTENRVSVFSRYKCIKQHETYDKMTAICVELDTEKGNLLVYGTIMGISGNRRSDFIPDVKAQMEDVNRFTSDGSSICVVGDYNLSFCDGWYYTKEGRRLVEETFSECGISILTWSRQECIDHIAISDAFVEEAISVCEWNKDKSLSDHKGIVLEIK
ncbi:MAG: hypothetical protein BACD_00116 [Bacteroides rodentium]